MKRISRHQVLSLAAVLALGVGVAGAQAYDPAAQSSAGDPNQPDPPQRVARISVLQGAASFESGSASGFSAAEINYPMTSGDRLYAAQASAAEIQTGQIAVRLGEQTDLTVTAMTDTVAQFGLAAGSVRLKEYDIEQGSTVELDTPNVAITVLQAGDIRVDVDANADVSYLTVHTGQVQVDGTNFEQVYGPGSRVRLDGMSPLRVTRFAEARQDSLDQFADGRDQQMEAGFESENEYLNAGTVGGADLGSYGDWQQDADNGAVWFPRGVAVDWEPYRVGHWAWVSPWGWTWVETEPWGFAPFHYGRWARFGPRWGWIPGPPVVRPVWAPALVVFVGGNDFSAGLGYSDGVTGWFPLGPREVYQPWYRVSPRYVNRVNVSNIWNRDQRNVRQIYDQRTAYAGFNRGGDPRGGYAYRDRAVAMPQAAFAAGKPAGANRVRVRPEDLAKAGVIDRAPGTPTRGSGGGAGAPPRTLPPNPSRPVLDNRRGIQGGEQGRQQPGGSGNGGSGDGAPIQRQPPSNGNQQPRGDRGGSGDSRSGGGQPSQGGNMPPSNPRQSKPMPAPGGTGQQPPNQNPGQGQQQPGNSSGFHARPIQGGNGQGVDTPAAPPQNGNGQGGNGSYRIGGNSGAPANGGNGGNRNGAGATPPQNSNGGSGNNSAPPATQPIHRMPPADPPHTTAPAPVASPPQPQPQPQPVQTPPTSGRRVPDHVWENRPVANPPRSVIQEPIPAQPRPEVHTQPQPQPQPQPRQEVHPQPQPAPQHIEHPAPAPAPAPQSQPAAPQPQQNPQRHSPMVHPVPAPQ